MTIDKTALIRAITEGMPTGWIDDYWQSRKDAAEIIRQHTAALNGSFYKRMPIVTREQMDRLVADIMLQHTAAPDAVEALRFYANEDNYQATEAGLMCCIGIDRGRRAKAAIEATGDASTRKDEVTQERLGRTAKPAVTETSPAIMISAPGEGNTCSAAPEACNECGGDGTIYHYEMGTRCAGHQCDCIMRDASLRKDEAMRGKAIEQPSPANLASCKISDVEALKAFKEGQKGKHHPIWGGKDAEDAFTPELERGRKPVSVSLEKCAMSLFGSADHWNGKHTTEENRERCRGKAKAVLDTAGVKYVD